MLITLGYLSLRKGIYFVEPADTNEFAEKIVERRKRVTIEQLRKTLEFEQRVGDAGEEFVLRFEKNRLHPFPGPSLLFSSEDTVPPDLSQYSTGLSPGRHCVFLTNAFFCVRTILLLPSHSRSLPNQSSVRNRTPITTTIKIAIRTAAALSFW